MPGTHLLPPNLLKLFAPRPPLPYTRPVDKDIDRVTKKDVSGVGNLLSLLKEGAMAGLANGTADGMEEGEEPTFTLAEEIKRQIRREERKKKRADEFQNAKDSCAYISSFSMVPSLKLRCQINHRKTRKQLATLTKLFSFLDWCVSVLHVYYPWLIKNHSTRAQQRMTFAENSKCTAQLNGSEL
jgi:U1 small nuclear ribonucleoprotein of 70kDa MW N terminal